jgi:hypothetical protein
MVTALKPSNFRQSKPKSEQDISSPDELRAVSSSGVRRRSRSHRSANPTVVDPSVVTALPRTQPTPGWLKLLIMTQRASLLLTFLLVGSALAAYGWTVYIQQQWGQEFRRLESLKKHERQFIAGNEALKHEMAEQAEAPTSGLMVPDPTNAFFLTPAPSRPPAEPERPPAAQAVPTKPLGY